MSDEKIKSVTKAGRLSDLFPDYVKFHKIRSYGNRGSHILRIKPYFVLLLVLSMLGSSIMSVQGFLPNTAETGPQTSTDHQQLGDGQFSRISSLAIENHDSNSLSASTSPPISNLASLPNGMSQYDKFGVLKIYPTKNAGEEWLMDMANPDVDKRFDPQEKITKNPDGSWKMRSKQVRMGVFPSTGYDSHVIPTKKESALESKGYMLGQNDWKNVEITGYVKFNSGSEDNFAWYGRGGRHTGDGPMTGCEGVAYKGDLYYSGKAQIAKEQWHVSYDYSPAKKVMGSIKDKWVGFKFVMYNTILPDGKLGVKLESWVDKNSDQQWEKVYDYTDSGGWGRDGTDCGGKPDQMITWGGPIATFRWDSANDVDFKFLSVREINGEDGPTVIPQTSQGSDVSPELGPTSSESVKGTDQSDESGGRGNERQASHDEPKDKDNMRTEHGRHIQNVEHSEKNTNHEKKSTPDTAEQGQSRPKEPQVVNYGKNIHVVWEDSSTGNSEIYYTKSIDGGFSFGEPVDLSNSISDSMNPKIKLGGANSIAVVYDENNDIYYTSSDNGGLSFSPPEDISNNPQTLSTEPSIDFGDSSRVKIIWIELDLPIAAPTLPIKNIAWKPNTIKSAVMMGQSNDEGKSFVTPSIVTSDRELDIHSPVIGTTASGKVYLCYVKGTEDDTDIHCNRSDDGGITFGSSTDVTKNPGSASLNPKLSVSGDSIHLVWADLDKGNDGNLDVFSMVASGDDGTFGGLTNLSNDPAGSVNPDISSSDNILHAVWGENTPGNNAIFIRNSENGGQTFDNKVLIGNNDTMTSHPSIASYGNEVIVVTAASDDLGDQNIIFQKSNDGGKTFDKAINLTGNSPQETERQTPQETEPQTPQEPDHCDTGAITCNPGAPDPGPAPEREPERQTPQEPERQTPQEPERQTPQEPGPPDPDPGPTDPDPEPTDPDPEPTDPDQCPPNCIIS